MAEEKRSISISYKADLKDLISKLKQMPNVTEAEAKKMVGALDKQLKQAEKAAKKSAEASKKASQNAAKAARRGVKDFDDMAEAARRAEERLEQVGEASGDIDRGFSSVGLALRGVNPQLAEAADGIADMFAVTEGLTMSFAALNPLVIAGGIAIGALTLGYVAHQAELEKVREDTLALRDAQKALIESQNEQQRNLEDAAFKIREQRLDYKLLTGQITEYQFNLEKAGEAANESFRGNIEAAKDTVTQTELLLGTVDSLIKMNKSSEDQQVILSDQELERLRTAQILNKEAANNLDLTKRGLTEQVALLHIQDQLQAQKAQEEKAVKAIEKMQEVAKDTAMEMVTLEKELADATEEAADHTERRAVASERALTAEELNNEALKEAFALSDDILKGKSLEEKMDKAMAMAFLDDEGKKKLAQRERLEEQIKAIEDLGLATGREAEAALAAIALRREAEEDLNDELLENEEKLQEKRKEGARANLDATFEMGEALAALADARINSDKIDVEAQKEKQEQVAQMGEIERSAYEQKQKQLRALFRFEKGMALAQVAMGTAEAIMAAQKLPIPFNAIQSGIAIATGVAQAGVVMSQQMPSFHMGGMAPDEATARVLRGEAILDRSTVRRIGGEQGVRNLQQGGSSSTNTVVIQPFKHFGRFAKDLGISKAQPVGIRGY
ncbi:hypothetical protein OAG66_00155 [bacterium]|nr:hypothetical protein [bacterium]